MGKIFYFTKKYSPMQLVGSAQGSKDSDLLKSPKKVYAKLQCNRCKKKKAFFERTKFQPEPSGPRSLGLPRSPSKNLETETPPSSDGSTSSGRPD
jgi:hypothetical protein